MFSVWNSPKVFPCLQATDEGLIAQCLKRFDKCKSLSVKHIVILQFIFVLNFFISLGFFTVIFRLCFFFLLFRSAWNICKYMYIRIAYTHPPYSVLGILFICLVYSLIFIFFFIPWSYNVNRYEILREMLWHKDYWGVNLRQIAV